MKFEEALKLIKMGVPMTRTKWKDAERVVTVTEEEGFRINALLPIRGEMERIPLGWSAGTEDLLADDWEPVR